MGKGMRAAGHGPEVIEALEDLIEQVIIVLVKKAGGRVVIPVEEIDDTGQYILGIEIKEKSFEFYVKKKN